MYTPIFTYRDYIHLVYDDRMVTCITTDQRNMHDDIQKVHRGVDNQIYFQVYNRDRRPQNVNHQTVRARMVNPQNGELVLERYLDHLPGDCKGRLRLDIFEGDLIDMPEGYYQLVITGSDDLTPTIVGHERQTPFFTDQDNNAVIDIEVTGQIQLEPRPSQTITEWIPYNGPDGLAHRSSAIPSGRMYNYTHSVHTLSVHCENYSGRIRFWGSLEDVPGENLNGYFPVYVTTRSNEIEVQEYTGTFPVVFQANYMWLKIEHIPADTNTGVLVKILGRS